MRRFHTILILLLSVASLRAQEQEINWTPRFITVESEGAVLERVFFTDGHNRFGISLDAETKVEAGDGGAKLTYKKVPSATFSIHAAARKLELPPDPKVIEDYRRAAMAYAPQGASDFGELQEEIDSLAINDWRSYRLTYSYSFFGRRERRSVTYLTFPNGQQAVLEVAALETEFKEAMGRSEHLIRTWHTLPPSGAAPSRN